MLEIGAARAEITAYEPRLGMMGWGMLHNVVERVATPLHARAVFVRDRDSGRVLAIAICEIAFMTLALREAVHHKLASSHRELGLDYASLLLAGTHTHSGPGGISHYPFYNVTIPGFAPSIVDRIASGIVDAIVTAAKRCVPADIRFGEAAFAPDVEVAFNRAIEAYNRNPDVDPVSAAHRHLAVDRTLRLLRFDAKDGTPIGSINWFSVHCTSVHSDNTALHFDNKGYAAQFVEANHNDPASRRSAAEGSYVAAFAQGSPGDVTPNFKRYPEKPWLRGKFLDDDESARWHGRMQADCAMRALAEAERAEPMTPRLATAHAFVDFSRIDVDPRFVGGQTGRRTAPAEIGMSMFFGTEEGPGLPRQLVFLQNWLAAARPFVRRLVAGRDAASVREHAETQAEKIPFAETGRRRLLGIRRLRRVPLPWRLNGALRMLRSMDRDDADPKPWTPNVLPVHLVVIGDLAICALPAEFTTIAARRVCTSIVADLSPLGVTQAVLSGYANAYAGYVTTPQEYEVQDYEGASTHFGKWTLPAYQTELAKLCEVVLGKREAKDDLRPPTFEPEELEAFPA